MKETKSDFLLFIILISYQSDHLYKSRGYTSTSCHLPIGLSLALSHIVLFLFFVLSFFVSHYLIYFSLSLILFSFVSLLFFLYFFCLFPLSLITLSLLLFCSPLPPFLSLFYILSFALRISVISPLFSLSLNPYYHSLSLLFYHLVLFSLVIFSIFLSFQLFLSPLFLSSHLFLPLLFLFSPCLSPVIFLPLFPDSHVSFSPPPLLFCFSHNLLSLSLSFLFLSLSISSPLFAFCRSLSLSLWGWVACTNNLHLKLTSAQNHKHKRKQNKGGKKEERQTKYLLFNNIDSSIAVAYPNYLLNSYLHSEQSTFYIQLYMHHHFKPVIDDTRFLSKSGSHIVFVSYFIAY